MQLRKILALVLVLLLGISIVGAADGVDDQGNPNDPAVNDNANACFEGGSLEDKCVTEWEWECGWHLIRLEEGLISESLFPSWCNILIQEGPPHTSIGCQVVIGPFHFDFGDSNIIAPPAIAYSDPDCTQFAYEFPFFLVYATSIEEANALCQSVEPGSSAGVSSSNPFVWGCFIT